MTSVAIEETEIGIMKMKNEEIVTMTSLEVVELINNFRKEEGNEIKKEHKTFMRDIRNEIEVLKNLKIEVENNFVPYSYVAENGKTNPCYKMNKAGIMQMLNKESALVRYKTQQYIEALENKLKQDPYENLSTEMKALLMHDKKIQAVEKEVKKVDKKFDDLPLFQTDLKLLKKLVNKKVVPLLGGKKSPAYKTMSKKVFSDIYRQVHREFGVTGCEEIKRKDLELVKDIVNEYELPMALEIDINTMNGQVAFA